MFLTIEIINQFSVMSIMNLVNLQQAAAMASFISTKSVIPEINSPIIRTDPAHNCTPAHSLLPPDRSVHSLCDPAHNCR